jgi:hypothetical protein
VFIERLFNHEVLARESHLLSQYMCKSSRAVDFRPCTASSAKVECAALRGAKEIPTVAKIVEHCKWHWWMFGIDRLVLEGSQCVDVLASVSASAEFHDIGTTGLNLS